MGNDPRGRLLMAQSEWTETVPSLNLPPPEPDGVQHGRAFRNYLPNANAKQVRILMPIPNPNTNTDANTDANPNTNPDPDPNPYPNPKSVLYYTKYLLGYHVRVQCLGTMFRCIVWVLCSDALGTISEDNVRVLCLDTIFGYNVWVYNIRKYIYVCNCSYKKSQLLNICVCFVDKCATCFTKKHAY